MENEIYDKATLQKMNNSLLGRNWIQIVGDADTYKLHATGNASLTGGRMYVALPSTMQITQEVQDRYNLW